MLEFLVDSMGELAAADGFVAGAGFGTLMMLPALVIAYHHGKRRAVRELVDRVENSARQAERQTLRWRA